MTPSNWVAIIGIAQVVILFFWGIALRYMAQTRDEARKQNGKIIALETWRFEHEKTALLFMQRFETALEKQDTVLRQLEITLNSLRRERD